MKEGVNQAIGEEIYDAQKQGGEMPQICGEEDEIRPDLMALIKTMTSCNSGDRQTALGVHQQLLEVRCRLDTISNIEQFSM